MPKYIKKKTLDILAAFSIQHLERTSRYVLHSVVHVQLAKWCIRNNYPVPTWSELSTHIRESFDIGAERTRINGRIDSEWAGLALKNIDI